MIYDDVFKIGNGRATASNEVKRAQQRLQDSVLTRQADLYD
jgi:hypothetical protein